MSQVHKFSILPVNASSIIGTNVANPKGDNLGNIKDIIIDRHTGRIAYMGDMSIYRSNWNWPIS